MDCNCADTNIVSPCWLQWVITELACYTFSMALVPLYDTLGLEAMVHILNLGEWVAVDFTFTSTTGFWFLMEIEMEMLGDDLWLFVGAVMWLTNYY